MMIDFNVGLTITISSTAESPFPFVCSEPFVSVLPLVCWSPFACDLVTLLVGGAPFVSDLAALLFVILNAW